MSRLVELNALTFDQMLVSTRAVGQRWHNNNRNFPRNRLNHNIRSQELQPVDRDVQLLHSYRLSLKHLWSWNSWHNNRQTPGSLFNLLQYMQRYTWFYIKRHTNKTSQHIWIILALLYSQHVWLHFSHWVYGHSATQLLSGSTLIFVQLCVPFWLNSHSNIPMII